MAWLFYLIYLMDAMKIFFCVLGGIGVTAIFIWYLMVLIEGADPPKLWIPIVSLFTLFIGIILPPKTTMYAMMGIELTEKIVTSEPAKNITNNTLDIVTLYLEKVKKELENENSNPGTSD
jgi:hypothetical protein